MKKKLCGAILILVSGVVLVAGFKAGGNAVAGGALLAALFVFLAFRLLGVIKSKKKKHPTASINQVKDPGVWIADGGEAYHQNDICQYLYGKKSKLVSRSDAKAQGLRPCKKCYPYGD